MQTCQENAHISNFKPTYLKHIARQITILQQFWQLRFDLL